MLDYDATALLDKGHIYRTAREYLDRYLPGAGTVGLDHAMDEFSRTERVVIEAMMRGFGDMAVELQRLKDEQANNAIELHTYRAQDRVNIDHFEQLRKEVQEHMAVVDEMIRDLAEGLEDVA